MWQACPLAVWMQCVGRAHHTFASKCTHAPQSTRSWAVRTGTGVNRSAPPGLCWKLLGQRRHPAQQLGHFMTNISVPAEAVTDSEADLPDRRQDAEHPELAAELIGRAGCSNVCAAGLAVHQARARRRLKVPLIAAQGGCRWGPCGWHRAAWFHGPALDAVLTEHPCTTISTAVHLSRQHSVQACLVMGPAQRSAAGAGHIGDGAACVHDDSEGSRGCSQLQCGVEVPAEADAGGFVCRVQVRCSQLQRCMVRTCTGDSQPLQVQGGCAQGVWTKAGPRFDVNDLSSGASTERRQQQG